MKYYLVALFDDDSYSNILHFQKNICKKYKLHHRSTKPHITLKVIEEPDIEKLDKLITKILSPYKKFKVNLNKKLYFETPHKSVNLSVENKGYIMRIARNIDSTLRLARFDVLNNDSNSKLNIFLGKSNSNGKSNFFSNENIKIPQNRKPNNPYNLAKISKIELWNSINIRRNTVVKSYTLKDY